MVVCVQALASVHGYVEMPVDQVGRDAVNGHAGVWVLVEDVGVDRIVCAVRACAMCGVRACV